jgi:hypothetical protein
MISERDRRFIIQCGTYSPTGSKRPSPHHRVPRFSVLQTPHQRRDVAQVIFALVYDKRGHMTSMRQNAESKGFTAEKQTTRRLEPVIRKPGNNHKGYAEMGTDVELRDSQNSLFAASLSTSTNQTEATPCCGTASLPRIRMAVKVHFYSAARYVGYFGLPAPKISNLMLLPQKRYR